MSAELACPRIRFAMGLIDRYLLKSLLAPTLLATAALSTVAVLSQSLDAVDLVVNRGQSAFTVLEIMLLTLPPLMVLVLPIALLIAALVALNRLHTEQEIVVCFASGMSRWQVIAPAMKLASVVTLIALLLNLWVAPLAGRVLRNEIFRVRTDFAASLIRLGEFTRPTKGLTVYAQDSDQTGALHNLFILQEQPSGGDITFLAARGKVTKRNGAPVLVLRDGSSQEFNAAGVLNYLKFDEYTLDLSSFIGRSGKFEYVVSDRYIHELLFPGPTPRTSRQTPTVLLAEANARIASPLYNIAFMALALAAVIGGPFSRLGYGRRIVLVAVLATVGRIMGFVVQAGSETHLWLNVAQYLIPVGLAWWAFDQLFRVRARTAPPRPAAPAAQPAGVLA